MKYFIWGVIGLMVAYIVYNICYYDSFMEFLEWFFVKNGRWHIHS
jgi:multisubunit Na+/H+ antiporter MnhB subunit